MATSLVGSKPLDPAQYLGSASPEVSLVFERLLEVDGDRRDEQGRVKTSIDVDIHKMSKPQQQELGRACLAYARDLTQKLVAQGPSTGAIFDPSSLHFAMALLDVAETTGVDTKLTRIAVGNQLVGAAREQAKRLLPGIEKNELALDSSEIRTLRDAMLVVTEMSNVRKSPEDMAVLRRAVTVIDQAYERRAQDPTLGDYAKTLSFFQILATIVLAVIGVALGGMLPGGWAIVGAIGGGIVGAGIGVGGIALFNKDEAKDKAEMAAHRELGAGRFLGNAVREEDAELSAQKLEEQISMAKQLMREVEAHGAPAAQMEQSQSRSVVNAPPPNRTHGLDAPKAKVR